MVVREMTGHTAEETIDKLSSIFQVYLGHYTVTGEPTIQVQSSKIFVKV